MAQLGTLWFDTRLKDGATADAERIRKELYHKLSNIPITVRLDDSNLSSMRQRISQALSSQSFMIKVGIDPSSLANLQKMGGLTEAQANAAKAAAEAALAEQKLATERQRTLIETIKAEKAEMQLDQARQKATASMRSHEQSMISFRASMNGGINAVTGMTSAMIGLYSIHTARQFLNNIVEIGGQLEKQRISMGAILGDTARANTLFNQIKQLAVKSPFGVVELDQYSKQLAAYGVEQSELFDMTKRLADISAGAGQDIGRLALALGHVKSATYLTGITLRQFSMNNIPMLKMLAEYYSEVEKRAVSTAEVQKRISARQVSYEDVVEQIRRMTDAGGMFYNMQEKISESVAAKWKNLKDSMDIMYGEMAEGALGDALKNTATMLMNLTKNWQEMLAVIGSAAAVWGAWRVAMSINNVLLGKNTVLTLQNINANRQAQRMVLRYAYSYRELTEQEQISAIGARRFMLAQKLHIPILNNMTAARRSAIVATRAQSIEELKNALNSKKVVAEDVAKAVALGQVSKARARAAITASYLTEAEKRAGIVAVNNVRTFGRFTAVVNGLSMGLSKLGMAMKSLFLSPQLWVFALISAVTELWTMNSRETERAKELNDDLFNKAEEGLKNIRQMMEQTQMTFDKGNNSVLFPSADSLSIDAMRNSINTWTEFIKEYSATPNLMLEAAFATDKNGESVHSLSEQYTILGENVKVVIQAYEHLKDVSPIVEDSINKAKSSRVDNDLLTDMKDYEDSLKSQQSVISDFYKKYKRNVSVAIEAARADKEFAKAITETGIAAEDSMSQIQLLINNTDKYSEAAKAFKKALDEVGEVDYEDWSEVIDTGSIKRAEDELKNEFEQFAIDFKSRLEMLGWDLSNLTPAQIQTLSMAIGEMMNKAGVSVDAVRNKIVQLANQFGIKIKLDIDTVQAAAKTDELKNSLSKLVGEDWVIDIKVDSNFDEVVNQVKHSYARAVDFFDTVKPLLIKVGIDPSKMATLSEGEIQAAMKRFLQKNPEGDATAIRKLLEQYNSILAEFSNATAFHRATGISLDKKSGGGTKTPKAKTAQKTADEALKKAQTQFDELKAFLDEYKKYSKTYSKEKSISLLEDLFPTTKDKGRDIVDNFKGVLKQLRDSLPMSSEERKKFGISIDKYIADFDQNEAEKELDKQLQYIKEYISENADKYNLYKTLFEKTGDEDFARLAFSNGRIFDEFAKELAAKLQAVVGDKVVDYDMSDVDAKEYFKDLTGAYDIWKKIVDLTSKNYQNALKNSADAQAKILTNGQKIANLEKKIADAKADTSGIDRSAEIKEWTDEIEKLKSEMFELLPIYEEIFGDRKFKSYNELKKLEKIVRELIKNKKVTAKDKNGRASYFSSFYMDGDKEHKVNMSRQALEKLRNVIKDFDKDEKKANPFKALADGIKDMWDKMHDGDAKATAEDWRKLADQLSEVAKIVGDLAGGLSDMFDALGNEGMADAMSDIQAGMNSVNNIAQGFATGNVVGGIIAMGSEAVGWVTRIAQKHDKKLDKAIQKSEREVKKLQNAYKNLEWEIGNQLSAVSKQQSAQMIADLEASEKELERQLALERKKKKDDPDKIIDLEQSITEAKQQIRTFYAEMGKERYGLDIDSWASDLANAMVEAFAAGEDAAEAFDQKVADIMKDVVSQIIKINIVKPAMASLQDYLFGSKGIATTNSDNGIEISANEAIGLVKELEKLKSQIDSGSNIYSVVAEAMESMGLDMSGDAKSGGSSLGNSIQGITEDTADLLAGYINSIRADVAMNRELLTVALPSLTVEIQRHSELAQLQVTYQEQIAANTLRNAEAADQIYDLLHRVEIGGSYLNVR